MGKAKDLILRPVSSKDANTFMKQVHYSGKVVQNSQIHIGVFYHGKMEGALQFGPSLDKRKLIGLVDGTLWNEFIELNRLAFTDVLPRNSESRAIAVAMRILRKHAPQLKWVVSYADATQCGDGTIYRASGFVLTGVKNNTQVYQFPMPDEMDDSPLLDAGLSNEQISVLRQWLKSIQANNARHPVAHKMTGDFHMWPSERRQVMEQLEGNPRSHKMSLEDGVRPNKILSVVKEIMRQVTQGATSADRLFRLMGGEPAQGFQLRYIYFLDKTCRDKLAVPELPFSEIQRLGAGMYKGVKHADN